MRTTKPKVSGKGHTPENQLGSQNSITDIEGGVKSNVIVTGGQHVTVIQKDEISAPLVGGVQGLKTTVFERQLGLLDEIETFFKYNTSAQFSERFAFDQCIVLNAWNMLKKYAQTQFGVKLNDENGPNISWSSANFHDDTPVIVLDSPRRPEPEEENLNDDQTWDEYFHYIVYFPDKFMEASEKVDDFLQSPLLPKDLAPLIKDFRTNLGYNAKAIRDTMNECASEFPEAYPDIDSLNMFHTSWIWNRYNSRARDLSEPARKILDYLRLYLGTDQLLEY